MADDADEKSTHDIVQQALQIVAGFYHDVYDGNDRQRALDIAYVDNTLATLISAEQADALLEQAAKALGDTRPAGDEDGKTILNELGDAIYVCTDADRKRAEALRDDAASVIGSDMYPSIAGMDTTIWLSDMDKEDAAACAALQSNNIGA